jgi:hypothetical protein
MKYMKLLTDLGITCISNITRRDGVAFFTPGTHRKSTPLNDDVSITVVLLFTLFPSAGALAITQV